MDTKSRQNPSSKKILNPSIEIPDEVPDTYNLYVFLFLTEDCIEKKLRGVFIFKSRCKFEYHQLTLHCTTIQL